MSLPGTSSSLCYGNVHIGAIVIAAGAMTLAAGCNRGMDGIDRRLAKVLGESAARASLNTAPRIQASTGGPQRERSRYETNPATTNPAAEDLSYAELDRGEPGTAEVVEGLNDRLRNYALTAGGIGADNVVQLSLTDAFRLAQRQGREYLSAEEDYIFSAIRLLTERHRWGPRLFADSNVSVGGDGDEGRFDNAMSVVNTLRATHRLPYGGEAEARWVWNATEKLRSSVTGQYQQSSALVLDASIPLLRGAGMVAREDIIQAERDLVYAARDFEGFRREYFVSIAQDYFQLIQSVTGLQNRLLQLESLKLLVLQKEAFYEAGRVDEFDVNEARNNLLTTRSSLASTREQYTLQVDRFKLRLGIPIEQPVQLIGARIQIAEPSTTIELATESALSYRLDLQNRRDQFTDSERGVLTARNQLLPDLNFTGEVRLPTDPDVSEGGLAIDPDEASWSTGLLLSIPLDRRIERLQLRQALIRLEQSRRTLDEFTDNVVLDARRRVREIDLSRFRLELAEASVKINERRQAEQLLKADEVDTRDRLQTETDLLDAKNERDQALTDLRIAILNYLDAVGQLRVSPDGIIDPLPGMTVEIEDQPIDFEALFTDDQPVSPADVAAPAGAEVPAEGE
jgi:outer membrane protein TolC